MTLCAVATTSTSGECLRPGVAGIRTAWGISSMMIAVIINVVNVVPAFALAGYGG